MSQLITIRNALKFAEKAHGDQRYGALPYKRHLLDVLSVLFEFEITIEEVLVAAILHDVLEDTVVTKEQLIEEFSQTVADLVWAVSDPPEVEGRKEKKKVVYGRIPTVPRAVLVKQADRIANMRMCWREAVTNTKKRNRIGKYKSEYGGFRKALLDENGSEQEKAMWVELDSLHYWNP